MVTIVHYRDLLDHAVRMHIFRSTTEFFLHAIPCKYMVIIANYRDSAYIRVNKYSKLNFSTNNRNVDDFLNAMNKFLGYCIYGGIKDCV